MKKAILINILILFGLLLALETVCSFVFYVKDEKSQLALSESVVDFPYVYYTFLPENKNGSVIVNNDGLYAHYERYKPGNTIRILLVGGSTARGMLSTNTIGGVLEKLLQNTFPRKRIEVVNAGMSGYVVEQLFIFYQLVLSKYEPDIVVGLNGYNDLMSVKLNRYSGLYFAPQNMQQFKVIQEGKRKRALMGRLAYVLPGTFRMAGYLKRIFLNQSQYDYTSFDKEKTEEASTSYIGIIKDIHDFCKVHNVDYLEFLQPLRWYGKGISQRRGENAGIIQLFDLYTSYEKKLTGLSYGYSLTGLFKGKDGLFKDDCHVSDIGNELIAYAMLNLVEKAVRKKINEGE